MVKKNLEKLKKNELIKLELFLHECLILREKSNRLKKGSFNKELSIIMNENKSFFLKYSLSTFIDASGEPHYLNFIINSIEEEINKINEFLDKRYKSILIKNEEKRNRNIERFTKVLAIGVLVQILNYTFNIVHTLNEDKSLVILGLSIISIVTYILLLIVALRIMNKEGKLLKEFNDNKLVKYTIYFALTLILLQLIYELFLILSNIIFSIKNLV